MILFKNEILSLSEALVRFNMLPSSSRDKLVLGLKIENHVLLMKKQLPKLIQSSSKPFTFI